LSTTFDDLLETAVKANRKKLKVINYGIIPAAATEYNTVEGDDTVVFNLLGSVNGVTEFAADDESRLEYMYSLHPNNDPEKHPQAKLLYQFLRGKKLLFIGSGMPQWLMRFMIRVLSGTRLRNKEISEYVIDKSMRTDSGLQFFLSELGSNVILVDETQMHDALKFVDILYDRWQENRDHVIEILDGSVFLSYNKNDRSATVELCRSLQAGGVKVWYDESDLEVGRHEENIKNNIKLSRIFVPVISDRILAMTDADSYARRVEWNFAKVKTEFESDPEKFAVFPIIVDKTAKTDERIPEFMRKNAIRYYPDEKAEIFDSIKNYLN